MMESFTLNPGFCPVCGSIFSSPNNNKELTCYTCKKNFKADVFGEHTVEYVIHFNSCDVINSVKHDSNAPDGPVVERKCSKCGYKKMSYATMQLRSADEGQTVFFTCLKCRFKEVENS